MRALWLPWGLLVGGLVLAGAAGAGTGLLALEVPASEQDLAAQSAGSDAGSTTDPTKALPGTGGAAAPPPTSGGNGDLPGDGRFGLDEALSPGLGEGLYFAVGVGVGLLGLAAASLLGTRYVTNENVLENDARRAIFEYIKDNPGCHLRETAGALQLSTTNVLWHLRKLEESNLVAGKKLEGYKVFYPVEGGIEAKRMGLALAVLRNPNARQVLGMIARTPGVHQREIARMLDVNHGTVRWHLKKLGIVQLVLEVKKGAISMYYISALGLQALERVELAPARTAQPPPGPERVEVAAPLVATSPGPSDLAEA
jgi:predicted transcriptional regulator